MNSNYKFNPIRETQNIIDQIKKYFADNCSCCKAIIGISGGKDSTIVAALCAAALGKENVVGVLLPHGEQHDIEVADAVASEYCGQYEACNIDIICLDIYTALANNCMNKPQVTTNVPARVRMTMLYAYAAIHNGIVMNTSNYSELYVGYSTKFGDGAGDFSPIREYTVTELMDIGKVLGIPDEWLFKTPEDGMSGKTDEDNLGFTYKELDKYIMFNEVPEYEKFIKITEAHKYNYHKLKAQIIPACRRINYPFRLEYSESDWCF